MVPEIMASPEPACILVVEDEVLIRCLIADGLREVGYKVIEAQNADEADSYLQSGGRVDLIFSDINMPGSMNGMDLARKLRRERPSLPIILTSANLEPTRAQGSLLFLPKPYGLDRAVALIERLIGAAGSGSGA